MDFISDYKIPDSMVDIYGQDAELRALWQRNKKLESNFYKPYQDRIFIDGNKFYALKSSKEGFVRYKISNFIFHVKKIVVEGSDTQTIMDILTPIQKYEDVVVKSAAFANLAEFQKVLKKVDRTLYIKSGEYLNLILDWNRDDFNEKKIKGTKKTGIHNDLFVTNKRTYKSDLKTATEDLMFLDTHEYIKSNIMQAGRLKSEDKNKEFLKALMGFNSPNKCICILSWCMACFYKERLLEAGYKLPILTLVGEAGAGKTTTADTIIRNIFWTDNLLDAGGSTKFTLLKNANSSNCTPLILDEYKPNKLSVYQLNTLSQFFRNIYDVAKEQRGQADQSIETFTLTAPLVVIGESVTNENALTERSIFLDFFKKDLEEFPDSPANMKYLKINKDKIRRLGFEMLHYAMNDNISNEELRTEIEKIEASLNIETDRIRASTAILAYFYSVVCKMLGVTQKIDCADVLGSMITTNLSGTNLKSELTRTLEIINIMIERSILKEDYDYKQKDDVFSISATRVFLKLNKFIKDYSIDDNLLGREQFQKAVRKQDYFIEYKNVKLVNRDVYGIDDIGDSKSIAVKCYCLDINKLKKVTENLNALECTSDVFEE